MLFYWQNVHDGGVRGDDRVNGHGDDRDGGPLQPLLSLYILCK